MAESGQLHVLAALPPEKEPSSTYWVGGWMGPRAGLNAMANRKKHLPLLGN